jgi:TPP-dependent indolepyruvate ferredoxin oxidoreductase alpha subunit
MLYPGSSQGNFGGSCGPWSRLISNRFVADIASACDVPIMGGGGISRWEHVIESIMYGASAVQLCTAVMYEGFELITKIIEKLSAFMDAEGHKNFGILRGNALKNVIPPHQMQYNDVAANIDTGICTGCRVCLKLPTCDAIVYSNKKCTVDPVKCIGCGLCRSACPAQAIQMKAV